MKATMALAVLLYTMANQAYAEIDPVRLCLDGMDAECRKLHNPGDDKDGFIACLDLMRPVCDTAYMDATVPAEAPAAPK